MSGENTNRPPRAGRLVKEHQSQAPPRRLQQEQQSQAPPRRLQQELQSQAPPRRLQTERKTQAIQPRLQEERNSQAMPPRLGQEFQSQAAPPRLQEESMSNRSPFRLGQEFQSQAAPPRLQQKLMSQAQALDNMDEIIDDTIDEQMTNDIFGDFGNLNNDSFSNNANSLVIQDDLVQQAPILEKWEWTDWVDKGQPFEPSCLMEESLPQLTFHRNMHGCLPLNWMPAIMEYRRSEQSSSKFKTLIFQDDVAITDAVLESWYTHLKGEFHPSHIESINLQGCRFVTDWGIHWLAKLLKGKTGLTKVRLDGCSEVTEKGLLELCASGPVLDLSCCNTGITSLPEIINSQRPQHSVTMENLRMTQDTEKKLFGPYNKVVIHTNRLCSTSLLQKLCNREDTTTTSAAMVTDMEINPSDRLLQEHKEKPLKMNILELSQIDACSGLMSSAESDQVVIPFGDSNGIDEIANMVTDHMKQIISKERPGVSSCYEEVKADLPTPLWSIQAVQEFLVDFYTGIVELSPYEEMKDCRLMFGEQMGRLYFNKLELEVIECDAKTDASPCHLGLQLMDVGGNKTCTLGEISIKAGDNIVVEYLTTDEISLTQNSTTTAERVKGFQNAIPVLIAKPDFRMKLKVKNFNCLDSEDPPQCFVKTNFNNQDYLFDPSTGILRCDNSAKNTFAFRGKRGLFSAVQPLSNNNNSIAIRILELGDTGEIRFGLTHLIQHSLKASSNPWESSNNTLYLEVNKEMIRFRSPKDSGYIEANIPDFDRDDILKIEVEGLNKDHVEAEDTVTVKFFCNDVQFCEKAWKGEFAGRIYPAVSLNNLDEGVQILHFKDPKPLHLRIADSMSGNVLICGQSKCKLGDGIIEAGPNCRDQGDYKEYFMAANSLSVYQPFYQITVKHVDKQSLFSLGLVHANHLKSKSPGNSQGSVGWIFSSKGNDVHVSQEKAKKSQNNTKDVGSTLNSVLGCRFLTEKLLWDEYGLPIPYQDISVCFDLDGNRVHEETFRYLGGGLYPYIQMGQAGIKIQINQLLSQGFSSVHNQPKNIPASPGTQFILAAVTSEGKKRDWTEQVKSIGNAIKGNLEKYGKKLKRQKHKLLSSSKVSFQDHQTVSGLSRAEHNVKALLEDWGKRTTFVCVNEDDSKNGTAELSDVLGRNAECAVLHNPHLYYYADSRALRVLDDICGLGGEMIYTLQQIQERFISEEARPQILLIQSLLRRLHHWGKVILFPPDDPSFVITDPEWFMRILSLLPKEPETSSQAFLECVGKDTPLWTPKELLSKKAVRTELARVKHSKEKIVLLLRMLMESGLLMRLKPHRTLSSHPRYFLTQPSTLGALPSQSALKKYYDPLAKKKDDNIVRESKVYLFRLEPLRPHVWYSVLATVSEFCEPKMLWNEGMVWHQGPVECVLIVQNSDKGDSSLIFEAKTYSVSVDSSSLTPRSKSILRDVFKTFTDVIEAILMQHSVMAESHLKNQQEYDEPVICSVHQWQVPQGQSGVSVCSLCNNCCAEGLRCDHNGIIGDKPLVCMCETQSNCCYHCGLCQKCASKLWTYRSKLQPGSLIEKDRGRKKVTSMMSVSSIVAKTLSSFPIDPAVCNEFYIRVPHKDITDAPSPSWGLLSEDRDNFYVCVSSRILLDCPHVAYNYPVNPTNLSFFTMVPGYKSEQHAVYKVKLCEPKIPQVEEDPAMPHKFNFSAMSGVNMYDETGIVECQQNNWTNTKVTGYIVSKLPLSPKCFYYETEIMAIGSGGGFAGIGLAPFESEAKYGRIKYGFQASGSNTLFGELEEQAKHEFAVLPVVKVGDRLGVGMIHNNQDDSNQLFFTVNGVRQTLKVLCSKELSGHVVVQDEGWRVRLTTRGVWRYYEEDLQEAVDAYMEREKAKQDWGKHDVIDISPQSLLKFQAAPKLPGQEDELHAQIVIKANPDKQHHVLYKIEISHFKRYVVEPIKGIIPPGQTAVVNVRGKCDETADLSLDKFRVEWKVDVMELCVKNYGTEYTGFGQYRHRDGPFSIFDNKWTVAWSNSENTRSEKHAVLFCKIVSGIRELEGVMWIDEFVKNIYKKKKESIIVPQPLPKVGDSQPSSPQYVLEVYKDEKLCSQSWIPQKKYYIAKMVESDKDMQTDRHPLGEREVSQGVFVPRLPMLPNPTKFVPGMKVYKAFPPELFASALSILVKQQKSILLNEAGRKSYKSKAKVSSKVNFSESVEVIDKTESLSITKDDAEIARDLKLSVMYGPCTVRQVLGEAAQERLLLQWDLGDLTPQEDGTHQTKQDAQGGEEQQSWRSFVCEASELHSQFWVDHMDCFHPDRHLERESPHKNITFLDSDSSLDYNWDQQMRSAAIKVNRHQLLRSPSGEQQFDAVRGDVGFSTGVHVFHIDVKTDSKTLLEPILFGVVTDDEDMNGRIGETVLGKSENSWAYDVTKGETYHRDITTPILKSGLNVLQHACKQGDLGKVTHLLNMGADIDVATPDGLTPLHLACYEHSAELSELLLDRGADVNKPTKTGLRPLHLACYEHQPDLLELFLSGGANVNNTTKRGNTALHVACMGGYVDLVERLLESDAQLDLQTVNNGYTALHIAAQDNYVEIVKLLVEKGADQDIKTHDGHTALTEALQRHHQQVVALLAGDKDVSTIQVPSAQTTAKEVITDEKAPKPKPVSYMTVEMTLNFLNPKWPFIMFRFPQLLDFICIPFEGPTLIEALGNDNDLFPCIGIGPADCKVRCSIKRVFSGETDEIPDELEPWERIGIYKPSEPVSYEQIPGPNLFPSEKAYLSSMSSGIPMHLKERFNDFANDVLAKGTSANSASCKNGGLLTAGLREFEELHNYPLMSMLNHVNFLPPSVFVPLPKVLSIDTLRYPSLETISDVTNLNLHFLCKPTEAGFEELHQLMYMLHFVDRPGEQMEQSLPPHLCFGACAIAMAYISTRKVLLPKYDHLVDKSVSEQRSRTQIEHLMENYLRMLSSVAMANFKTRDFQVVDEHALVIKHKEERFEDDFKMIGNYISDNTKQKILSKNVEKQKKEEWMCNSHFYDLITGQGVLGPEYVQDVHYSGNIVQDGVLNLQPFEPYNELITAIRLTTHMDQLEEVPAHFQDMFPNLKILLVDQANSLKKLPPSIGKLKKLKILSFTTAEDIMTEELPHDIGDCKDLEEIRLPRAFMKTLPESVTTNRRLKVLVVNSNSIRQLPDMMGELRSLQVVNLNSNPIARLPQSAAILKNLRELHLAGITFMPTKVLYREKEPYEQWFKNQEKDIIKVLTFNRVQEMYSSCRTLEEGTQVTDLHKINAHLFYEVPRLGLDYVSGDEDGGIPEAIFHLENLETLDLSNQAIRFVPPQISRLIKLEKLILSKNMLLESLPGSLGSMKKLRMIGLRHCPSMKTPSAEIIGRGVQAIAAFLRRLSGGTQENWRTKLMLVGLGGAGKTSLLRALMSPTHKTVGTNASELTDGIDIKPWTVQDQRGRKITYSTWDFAGQDVYYNTHQFFLSGRAVYLLLWTCRLGFEHAGLDFWLSSIQCHAPKAPIFIVGTHCDQVSKPQIPVEMLLKKYPQIKGFHFVSSVQGTGILNLEKKLIEVTKLESYMGEAVPTVYLSLENKILQLRKEKNVIPWTDVQELAMQCAIFNVDDIKRAVTFLHDLGTVQYFDNEFLRDHVVINPQWIVDVMACVVSVKNSPIEDGKFHHSSMLKVWKDYPVELHEWLLRLTEEFDLTFPIPSEPINLVPCLLPQTEAKFEWPEVREGERETMMLYRFTYLPAGLFNRTQVRLFQFSDGKDIWKRGALLRKNDHLALIKQLNDKEMLVRVQGPRPENVLFLIHEVIESLVVESFSGVRYDFLVPCPDCIKKSGSNLPEKALFESSLIKEAVEWNSPFLQCRMHFHTVSMSVLQAGIPSDRGHEIDVHLTQSMQALEDLRSSAAQDVFIHYCDDDLPSLTDTAAIHPSMVVKDLQKAGFSCWYRDNLSKVDIQDVTLGLQNSKMMVLFMSNNYEKKRQCSDLFKYAKHTLNKPYQVVAFGEDMNWTKTNMGGMEIGSHHVFVNMRQKDRYPTKIAELQKHVKSKLDSLKQTSAFPRCFISYAWSNSHEAVKLGSKHVAGALGWEKGDPRYIKEQLEAQGISCWLDTEQTGKAGLFEDISKGIRHADVVIAFVSTEYTKSKNCMMELRFAECALEKPIVAVSVGTSDDWRFSEVLMLLNRTKTPVIHMQTPNEQGVNRIISLAKQHIASAASKTQDPGKTTSSTANKEPVRFTEVSFQEEYELAQRRLLRHVSHLAAMMDTTPYPRLFVLDFKETPHRHERPMSARSVRHDSIEQTHHLHKRDSKITARVDEYDSSWVDSPFVVKLFCEYDGGWHAMPDGLDLTDDLQLSEREDAVRLWSDYLGRIYSLLKHSTMALNLLNMEQGKHLHTFINHCMGESDGNFSDAYIKLRDKIMAIDKDRIMGKLDRCHLPTGQIRWLCAEHQKGHRITVLSSDVDVGALYGEDHLVTDDDVLIKEKIEELSNLADPYIKGRASQEPRKMTCDPQESKGNQEYFDQETKPTTASTDLPKPSSPGPGDTDKEAGKVKPTPKPRLSRLGTPDRPVSANTKTKMKVGAKAIQSGDGTEKQTSSACQIL